MNKMNQLWVLVLILVLGLALRLTGIEWGLPTKTETLGEIYETVDTALEMAKIHPHICFNLGLYLPYPEPRFTNLPGQRVLKSLLILKDGENGMYTARSLSLHGLSRQADAAKR